MVRSSGLALALIGALAAPGAASAQAQAAPDSLIQANREVGIGLSTLYRSYQESFPAGTPGRDREGGWNVGVQGSGAWMGDLLGQRDLYASATVAFDTGRPDYRGSVFASNEPLNFNSGLNNTLVQAQLGKGFMLSPRLMIVPLARFGYQWWNRDLGPGQTEDYRSVQAGVGVDLQYAAARRLVLRGGVGLQEEIAPQITFNYLHAYTANLGARAIYDGHVGLDYAVTRRLHLSADAVVSLYGYGRSPSLITTERGLIFEPASTTTDTRLQLGAAWAF